ncbi:MAG: threonine-phosphate decarboxylase [Synechococcales cyanobacterium T60_A2020_003]|nr:threonine-phosphate decarboxylase [Synechococcales cyanobacterium T60_A2020_003]
MSSQSLDRPHHGGNLIWAAQLSGTSPSSILDFSASINPLGPPASVLSAIQHQINQIRVYPDPDTHELRTVLSAFHRVPADFILPGNGSAELLTWACRELAECDATYLITPAFGDYRRALLAFDATIAPCPIAIPSPPPANTAPFITALKTLLDAPPQAGVLLNNPHNPTGYLASLDVLRPILEHFALVVVDEAFMDFLPGEPESVIPWIEHYPNLVVLRSLTKFYSVPGLRIGYAIAHPDRLKRWQRWRDPWSVNALATVAAIAAVQDHDFQQCTWDWLSEARSQLFQGIQAIPGLHPLPGAVNYLLVHSSVSVPDLQYALLQQHQILIRDCLSFPELGDRFFRIAVRTVAENQRLLSALTERLPT